MTERYDKGVPGDITPEAMRAETEFLYNAGAKAQKALDDARRPDVFDVDGHKYISTGSSWQRLKPPEPERLVMMEPFTAYSLSGLADYIKADPDGNFQDADVRYIVHVVSPTTVKVVSPVTGYHLERQVAAICVAHTPDILFGTFMDPEEFQIMVQTCFQETENRAKVLLLAGSLRKEQAMQTADDGVSQKVTVNAGVATAADVIVKNPVTLVPWRTFREIEQPESPFVLRFNEDAKAALFTGDNAGWQMRAVELVGEWLRTALDGCNVEVIA